MLVRRVARGDGEGDENVFMKMLNQKQTLIPCVAQVEKVRKTGWRWELESFTQGHWQKPVL